jgi:mono/diheme cytochrome c family protein
LKNIIKMKKLSIITFFVLAVVVWSCSDVKREPSRAYMPDMAYSRAFETYASHDTLKAQGINYTAIPVAGTIKRGELFPFPIKKDAEGDSAQTNYKAAREIVNPLTSLSPDQAKEAERLYLVNCGICHGTKMDGNGPLYNDGKGPYGVAPKNLLGDPVVSVMPEGQIFYSVTYGKNQMGPYASQLSTTQRWMVVKYIKEKQTQKNAGAQPTGGGADSTKASSTGATKTDSAATK